MKHKDNTAPLGIVQFRFMKRDEKMVEVFAYVMGASHTTHGVECSVPESIDETTIFFGPCKRRLRESLRTTFLQGTDAKDVSKLEFYLVGFNASNPRKDRRIIWSGKIDKLMTFEFAWKLLTGKGMRLESLHLKPLYKNGQLIGYKHRGKLHKENDEWVWDLVNKTRTTVRNLYSLKDAELVLKDPKDREKVFTRDCCFLCEKLFFAGNGVEGMRITSKILGIFKKEQPDKEIDEYHIFGRKPPQDFTLCLKGETANQLVEELKSLH